RHTRAITGEGYAALALALKSNPSSNLKELDLRRNNPGDNGLEMLADLLQDEKFKLETLRLNECELTEDSCEHLATALISKDSELTELNLSNSKLGGSSVQSLSTALKNPTCKLEILRLSDCSVGEEGYTALASALNSNSSSHLKELDLRGNNPGASGVQRIINTSSGSKPRKIRLLKNSDADAALDSLTKSLNKHPLLLTEMDLRKYTPHHAGVKEICGVLEDSHCRLKTFKLYKSGSITGRDCADLISALIKNPSHLRELDLNENKLDESELQKLCDLLQDLDCKLEKLKLSDCHITGDGYSALALALKSNSSSNLIELDLRGNSPGDNGVELLADLLQDINCKLKTLSLSDCHITGEGYAALASALELNPSSHLRELDLRGNDPGDKGVAQLTKLHNDPKYKLESLRLLKSDDAIQAHAFLSEHLQQDPLLLNELNLRNRKLDSTQMKQLSALLVDSHCKAKTLGLNECELTEDSCEHLATALISKDSKLTELNLSNSILGNSSVQKISTALMNQTCKLEILRLSDCSVGEDGYAALASALNSNSLSHLEELDLRGNSPGASGVQRIINTSSKSKARKIRLLKNSDADAALDSLTKTLKTHPLLLTEMDLTKYTPSHAGVKEMCGVLEDSHCRLKTFKLYKPGSIKESDCDDLISALNKNPSHLRELDVNQSKLDESGVQKLCDLLQNPDCKLEKLKLSDCHITGDGYSVLALALKSNSSSNLKELDLRGNSPGHNGVELLADLLQDTNCKLNTLRLLKSSEAEEACSSLTDVLDVNPLLQTELDLKGKIQGDSQVRQLSLLLEDPHCRLRKLKLLKSDDAVQAHTFLSEHLNKEPLLLNELNLRNRKLDSTQMKQLSALLVDSHCKAKTLGFHGIWEQKTHQGATRVLTPPYRTQRLTWAHKRSDRTRLNECELTEDSCEHLATALISENSKLTELNLSNSKLGDSSVQKISTALKNPTCKLEILRLYKSDSIKESDCADLISALNKNPSHLRELDLNQNKLDESGVQKLCTLLQDPDCKLEKLKLSNCSIKGEGYTALASALKSNPSSHLRELDLRGNDPGDTGVEKLTNLLKDSHCKLTTLRLLKGAAADICESLTTALGINPLLLRELDLTGKIQGDPEIKKLADLVKDLHCRTQKLK
ncbi:hypothetical protein NFI96_026015, partial [Prochilodus magdalenae]